MKDKSVFLLGTFALADYFFNNGVLTSMVVKALLKREQKQVIYITQKDLTDMAFGC